MKKLQTGSALRSSLATIAIIVALLGIAVIMLPEGYDDDLAKIGQGSNIVVLIQNKGAQQSMDLLNLLNQVRADYEGKVEFLIADTDTPEGRAFERQRQLDSSVLVFFAPDGAQLNIIRSNIDEIGLRMALNNTFTLAPR